MSDPRSNKIWINVPVLEPIEESDSENFLYQPCSSAAAEVLGLINPEDLIASKAIIDAFNSYYSARKASSVRLERQDLLEYALS